MKRITAILLCLVMLLTMAPVTALATTAQEYTYQLDGKEYTLRYDSTDYFGTESMVDGDIDYYYSDGFFTEDPADYSAHLAALSFLLSNCAHVNSRRSRIFLQTQGFTMDEINATFSAGTAASDSVAYLIAHKDLRYADGTPTGKTLVVVLPRSSGYRQEWCANFKLGVSGDATGFADAASEIVTVLKGHLDSERLAAGDYCFWTTGYSRGGGLANMIVLKMIDDGSFQLDKNEMYAYTFGCPAVAASGRTGDFSMIHNVVNSGDLIASVAPASLGVTRYGVVHYLDAEGSPFSTNSTIFRKELNTITQGKVTYGTAFQTKYLNLNLDAIRGWRNKGDIGKAAALAQVVAENRTLVSSISNETFTIDQLTPASTAKVAVNNYLEDLGQYLVKWCVKDRATYSQKIYSCTLDGSTCGTSIEEALGSWLTVIMSTNNTTLNQIGKCLGDLGNQMGLKDISADNLAAMDPLLRLASDMITWNSLSQQYKDEDITWVWSKLTACTADGKTIRQVAGEEIYETARQGFPAIFDLLMTFVSSDYSKNYTGGDEYAVANQRGVISGTLIGQLVSGFTQRAGGNVFDTCKVTILANHCSDNYYAALRAEDPLYNNNPDTGTAGYMSDETGHWKDCGCGMKVNYAQHVSTGDHVANCVHGNICDVCLEEYGSRDADRHVATLTEIPAATPTCIATGNNTYYHCEGCDACYKDAEGNQPTTAAAEMLQADPLNHDGAVLTRTEEKASTCQTTGNVVYYTCPDCNKTFSDALGQQPLENVTTEINPDAHEWDAAWSSNETSHYHKCLRSGCTATTATDLHDGTATCKTRATCSVCQKQYGDLGPHNFTAETATADYLKSAATCKSAAVYYKSCSVCGLSSKGQTDEATFTSGEPAAHVWKTAWNYNGTHHWHICENCSAVNEDSRATHTYDQQVEQAAFIAVKGDCVTPNTYYYRCICGAAGTQTFVGTAPGHAVNDTTWHYDDTNHWQSCSVCSDHANEGAHSFTDTNTASAYLKSAATCNSPAVYYKSCSVCGLSGKGLAGEKTFTSGNALGHQYGNPTWSWDDNAATATATFTCSRCTAGEQSHQVTLSGEDVVLRCTQRTASTCTRHGTNRYTATVVFGGKEYTSRAHDIQNVPLAEHNFTAQRTTAAYLKNAATCTEPDVYYKCCSVCGQSSAGFAGEVTFTNGSALGHSYAATDWQWAQDGKSATVTVECTGCTSETAGHTKELNAVVTGEVTAAPTCSKMGFTTYTAVATLSGAEFTDQTVLEDVEALDHDWAEATCMLPSICRRCGTTTGAALGHSYVDGTCEHCGNVSPVSGVKTENLTMTDQTVEDGNGLVMKSDLPLASVQDAVENGKVVAVVATCTEISLTGDGMTELAAMGTSESQKLVEKMNAIAETRGNSDSTVVMVVDLSMELQSAGGDRVADILETAQPQTIRLPITEEIYRKLNGKTVVVLDSHSDPNGEVEVTEISGSLIVEGGVYYVEFVTDRFSTFAIAAYNTQKSIFDGIDEKWALLILAGIIAAGQDTATEPAVRPASVPGTVDTQQSVKAVYVNDHRLSSGDYTVSNGKVTLTEAYLATLKAGVYTMRVCGDGADVITTFVVERDGVLSARTADTGIVFWSAIAVAAALTMGAAYVYKRRSCGE